MATSGIGYLCRRCGEYHRDLPLRYGIEAPSLWYEIPEEERDKRSRLTSSFCIIDDMHFITAGNLQLPIIGSGELLTWEIWVSVNREDFQNIQSFSGKSSRKPAEPVPGSLASEIPIYYPSTLNLKVRVHPMPRGLRPIVSLETCEHLLFEEQHRGITWIRMQEIAEFLLHGPKESGNGHEVGK